MNERKKLVPKLRFPEFRTAREWDTTVLGELSEVVRGGSPRPIEGFLTTAVDGLHWLKIGDVDKEAKYVTHTAEKVRPEALSKTRVVNPGDLILSNSMSFGRPYILQIKTCIHDGWIAVTHIGDEVTRDFLYYLISEPHSQRYFLNNAAGSGVQNLNADIIKALPVCHPPSSEQQKIADCLSSLDELITAQARKVDALKTHKKGLMQQLFPREGETQPRLRFPEFRVAGEWKQKTLEEIATIKSGSTPLRANDEFFVGGSIPWVKTTDLNNSFIATTEEKITAKAKARINPVGSVLVAMYGGFNQIGRTGCLSVPAATNQAISVLLLDQKIALPVYVLAWLNAKVEDWKRIASSSRKDPNITGSDVAKFLITLPEVKEQRRIADCVDSLDDLITTATQELDTLKTHKKGLMQQLFPSAEAAEA
ncbi:MAG: restriction endonuclease subunit S [Polaromonas sp.]|uniref:restriction endonuclease subunit S n=1 Tax=Polaromonas sp. TaxID=1869339 RepID=UPI0024889CCC|nr:restriction endonuclease subunit S [Polaromonas sp.]MDI1268838.1 restriction endonuclease subunit S [Polaromonas sp.]